MILGMIGSTERTKAVAELVRRQPPCARSSRRGGGSERSARRLVEVRLLEMRSAWSSAACRPPCAFPDRQDLCRTAVRPAGAGYLQATRSETARFYRAHRPGDAVRGCCKCVAGDNASHGTEKQRGRESFCFKNQGIRFSSNDWCMWDQQFGFLFAFSCPDPHPVPVLAETVEYMRRTAFSGWSENLQPSV